MCMRWISGMAVLAVLAGCGGREAPPPPFLSIALGSYDAQLAQACVSLDFSERRGVRYQIDANCDGAGEVSGTASVEEDRIFIGDAVLVVSAVGASSFSGTWQQGDIGQEVRFQRRPEQRRRG